MNSLIKWTLIILGILAIAFAGWAVYDSQSVVAKKPAVYLYPQEDQQILVKVNINGRMIEDIPTYDGGWDVFVTTESLIDDEYDYLFYEAKLQKIDVPTEGWVVAYESLDPWFEYYLNKLGLNKKEKYQFKEYWLEELDESNFYEIKLLSKEFLDENMDLIIEPKPDAEIRVIFLFKPIEENYPITNPEIITPLREGFTAVEWGGIMIK